MQKLVEAANVELERRHSHPRSQVGKCKPQEALVLNHGGSGDPLTPLNPRLQVWPEELKHGTSCMPYPRRRRSVRDSHSRAKSVADTSSIAATGEVFYLRLETASPLT